MSISCNVNQTWHCSHLSHCHLITIIASRKFQHCSILLATMSATIVLSWHANSHPFLDLHLIFTAEIYLFVSFAKGIDHVEIFIGAQVHITLMLPKPLVWLTRLMLLISSCFSCDPTIIVVRTVMLMAISWLGMVWVMYFKTLWLCHPIPTV